MVEAVVVLEVVVVGWEMEEGGTTGGLVVVVTAVGGFELTQTRQHTRGAISRSLFNIGGGALAANTLGRTAVWRTAVCHTASR